MKRRFIHSWPGPLIFWDRNKTFHNIIRKISADNVFGSNWDPNSIMQYPFGPGLIESPAQYQNGLFPTKGLSDIDQNMVRQFYPKVDRRTYIDLKPFHSEVISLQNGEQANFEFVPDETRVYTIRTFGEMDTVMVISEVIDGENEYISGDDDSGEDRNSLIKQKFIKNKKYIVNIRLYFKSSSGNTCVMVW